MLGWGEAKLRIMVEPYYRPACRICAASCSTPHFSTVFVVKTGTQRRVATDCSMRIAVDILVTKSSRRAASPMLETDVVVKMGRGVGVVGRALRQLDDGECWRGDCGYELLRDGRRGNDGGRGRLQTHAGVSEY